VEFRVLSPATHDVRLELLNGAAAGSYQLQPAGDGSQTCFVRNAGAGDRYVYSINGSDPRPDPASRFQPEGVHAPSQIVDPDAFRWRSSNWRGRHPRDLSLYELHVGTFTAEGTFAAARERLPQLRDLGVTAVELMPLAEFAGSRNWGYDGVCLYAPSHNYGSPDDLRALVDAAHGLGLAVILDVVYNHLGPEGAYLTQFYPAYMTDRHDTPWGGAINVDGPESAPVRRFLVDNAVSWIREFRLDGLRLDATHALIDDGPLHIVAEIAAAARAAASWPVAIYAEDHRNAAWQLEPVQQGGWGLDGVWADDFHHVVRRHLAGDSHSYYQDFEGSAAELAETLRHGWLFSGQYSRHSGGSRGTIATHVPMRKFVVCLQNHDQVGNRATGDRLHHRIDAAAWRAASALLLTAPMTPLLFMGQEWAASSPFQYFTDLEPELGALVTEGRRREFKAFPEFADPAAREGIPDPQAASTFEGSRLNWEERSAPEHAASLALYSDLLRLRHGHASLGASESNTIDARAVGNDAIAFWREGPEERFLVVVRLSGAGAVSVEAAGPQAPQTVLSTEDPRYASDPMPLNIRQEQTRTIVEFHRPGAAILKY
jgi:maltooligosyltrehalose trehalohydrolase